MAAFALLYAVLAKLFLHFATANGNVSFLYPPSGIALALLLIFGRRLWPAIFLGSLLESLWVNDPLVTSLLIAAGNTIASLMALHLLQRANFDHALARFYDVYILILCAAVSSIVAATVGVAALALAGIVDWYRLPFSLFTWWGGDTLGIILFTPLLLTWRQFPPSWFKPKRLAEVTTFYTLFWVFGLIIYFDQFSEYLAGYSTEFWVTPFIFYAALRLGLRGTLLLLALIMVQVSWSASNQVGAFAHDLDNTGMTNAWLYLSICTLIGLSLTVLNKQRNRNERELRESEQRYQNLAFHDALTGLPNRALFFDRLSQSIAQAKRNQRRMALIYLDLDGFKPINDQCGHELGDCALKSVASRLSGCVRNADTVARLGGDEFAVVLDDIGEPGEAAKVAQKILHALSVPLTLLDKQNCTELKTVGASIGIAVYPENGVQIDDLIAAADSAMYESKRNGKNQYAYSSANPAAAPQD